VVGRQDAGIHGPHGPNGAGEGRRLGMEDGDEARHPALDDLFIDDVGDVEPRLGPGLRGIVDLDRDRRAEAVAPPLVDQPG